VVAIPEGLEIAPAMSMALSLEQLLHENIIVKGVGALESIGTLDLLVFD